MIHIITSFDIIHEKKFEAHNDLLKKINGDNFQKNIRKEFDTYLQNTNNLETSMIDVLNKKMFSILGENLLKNEMESYFYNKSETIASVAFENNLSQKCVKKIHNLMTKKSYENIKIPESIKSHEKYTETIFDKNIQLRDIYNYMNFNIPCGETVLLCNGNYCIENTKKWDSLQVNTNELLCLSSNYKCINKEKQEYNQTLYESFVMQSPIQSTNDDNYEFFNTNNIKRVITYLLKDLNEYTVQNSDDYKSYLLHNDVQLNYHDNCQDNFKLLQQLNKIHIVTSFDIVHKKLFSTFDDVLSKMAEGVAKTNIKKGFDSYFYNKSEVISSLAFESNLLKSCVKRVHNLMTRTSHENITIPENIKSHEKYTETVFDKNIQMCDIYEYINENIDENDIVLLCNGNYCIGDWENIEIDDKEAFCLSSNYKYIGTSDIELEKYPFPDETLLLNKNMVEEAKVMMYYGLSHHAFMFRAPMECLLFDEFDFFNTVGVNKLMNHLLKNAGEYDIKNPHQYDSEVLYDNIETNYQNTCDDNLELNKSLNIDMIKYILFMC